MNNTFQGDAGLRQSSQVHQRHSLWLWRWAAHLPHPGTEGKQRGHHHKCRHSLAAAQLIHLSAPGKWTGECGLVHALLSVDYPLFNLPTMIGMEFIFIGCSGNISTFLKKLPQSVWSIFQEVRKELPLSPLAEDLVRSKKGNSRTPTPWIMKTAVQKWASHVEKLMERKLGCW